MSKHSKASSPVAVSVASDTNKSTKDSALEKVQSACSKPYKFYRNEPTSSPYHMSVEKQTNKDVSGCFCYEPV